MKQTLLKTWFFFNDSSHMFKMMADPILTFSIIKWKWRYNPPFPVLCRVIYWGVWQPHPRWKGAGVEGTTDFSVIRTARREGACVARCVILEWIPRWVNCHDFFLYIPYANFKLFLDHIISLRLPKECLNSHKCSFDINIVKNSTITRWSRSDRC